jgi:ubiquinone/menaquinone biosynthesis C-methylase UbiE
VLSEIVQANVAVHTLLAQSYNTNEPQFRPENQAKVRRNLEYLRQNTHGDRLLDIGCGTGFIINLAKDLFAQIDGVDITQAMLNQVDLSSGNITLHNTVAEKLPFEANTFDAVTAYSFLHHLEDYRPVLAEVKRVLKPGGLFYVDLEPNQQFWQGISDLEKSSATGLSDILLKEIDSVLHIDERMDQELNLEQGVFSKAEYIKSVLGGIDANEFKAAAEAVGFSECRIKFEWFLGQAAVMHGQSPEAAEIVESHLRRILPLSNHLFKYLQFILVN